MPFRSPREVWETALGSLQVQVSPAAYETWLRHTSGLSFDGAEFAIGAPNAFVAEWLERRMHSLLERTLTEVLKHPVRVSIRVAEDGDARQGRQPPRERRPLLLGQTPDPRFTFETFVVGENSRLAYAAARAVAEEPGRGYNPFVLYGPPGLGKTHLVHAVANASQAQQRATLLTTAEQFVTEFVGSVRAGQADAFRSRYRSAEVLLVEDIQFICGKGQSEEMLFHTCTSLLSAGRQIVLAADRPPAELPLANPRLASRLQGGLQVAVRPPDHGTRLAILAAKSAQLPLPVPEDVLLFLASRPRVNVHELEGDLTKAVAVASLLGQPLTLALASQALGNEGAGGLRAPLPTTILQAAATHFRVALADLSGKSREQNIVRARHMAMYLLRSHTGLSLQQIGRLLGGRDHTTVLHGVERIASILQSNAALQEAANAILHTASTTLPQT